MNIHSFIDSGAARLQLHPLPWLVQVKALVGHIIHPCSALTDPVHLSIDNHHEQLTFHIIHLPGLLLVLSAFWLLRPLDVDPEHQVFIWQDFWLGTNLLLNLSSTQPILFLNPRLLTRWKSFLIFLPPCRLHGP